MTRPPAPIDLQRRAGLARLTALWAAVTVPLVSCGGGDSAPPPNVPPSPPAPPPGGGSGGNTPPPPPPAPPPPPSQPLQVTRLNPNARLTAPWSFVFLPSGRMIVTLKAGQLALFSANYGSFATGFSGIPTVNTESQGGLLDIALDPDYTTPGSDWVYISYTEPDGAMLGTAVTRGRLDLVNNQFLDKPLTPLFRQFPKTGIPAHYGSRLAFRGDKTLFITLGEKQGLSPAQDLTTTLGKVVRINRDGSIPGNNPNMGAGARPGIWSYGHRNPQGAAVHPGTDELWISEHGPQGGDEINISRAGQNYGWPNVSYGCDYGQTTSTCMIGGGTHAPNYTEPVTWWPGPGNTPPYNSVAWSAMAFYTGTGFPEWQGSLLVAAQAGQALYRMTLSGNTITARDRIWEGERVRCVRQGPDGWIYFVTDDGWVYRLSR